MIYGCFSGGQYNNQTALTMAGQGGGASVEALITPYNYLPEVGFIRAKRFVGAFTRRQGDEMWRDSDHQYDRLLAAHFDARTWAPAWKGNL